MAHAKGVVRRDLKPSSVVLTADRRCKILDFGLARQTPGELLEGEISRAETLARPADGATREGAILGTVGYVSPEQYVWGRDAHNGQVFGAGVTWYFGLPQ